MANGSTPTTTITTTTTTSTPSTQPGEKWKFAGTCMKRIQKELVEIASDDSYPFKYDWLAGGAVWCGVVW